jgi:hypothetical protein
MQYRNNKHDHMSYSIRENSITTYKGFMVEACGCIAGQHLVGQVLLSKLISYQMYVYTNPEVNISIIIMNESKGNKISSSSIVYSCEGPGRP